MEAEAQSRLGEIGRLPDPAFPLADCALWLARATQPGLNLEPYRRHLTRLAEDVADFAGAAEVDPAAMRDALLQVVVRRYGYGGNEAVFDDLDAANLSRVIDSRRGLPVALGILYLDICGRLGWPLVGIDFPGRFVLRLGDGAGRLVVDPFEDLRPLDAQALRALLKAVIGPQAELTPNHMVEMTGRRVVLRLEDNIRVRQMRRGDLAAAAETLEAMLLVAPEDGVLWREAGVVNARLGQLQRAVAALEEYLRRAPGAESGYQASLLLQELRARLN